MRYGQIMRLYDDLVVPLQDEVDGAAIFAPFAGTEGYNPVAYLPYISRDHWCQARFPALVAPDASAWAGSVYGGSGVRNFGYSGSKVVVCDNRTASGVALQPFRSQC